MLVAESWRPVVGFEDRYEVSDEGRVRPVGTPRGRAIIDEVLSVQTDKKGYVYVHLWRDGKRSRRPMHQLVAEAFVGPRPPGYIIDHLDDTPGNNRPSNLEWVTDSINQKRSYERGRKHALDCQCVVCQRTRDKMTPSERREKDAQRVRDRNQARMPDDAPFRCNCGSRFMTQKALSVHSTRMHGGPAQPAGLSAGTEGASHE